MKYTVPNKDSGKRLDIFLSELLCKSRSVVQSYIPTGVYVNGLLSKASAKLKSFDIVEFDEKNFPKEEKQSISEENDIKSKEGNLNIVYEDKDLLVINKEHGIAVLPGINHPSDTIANYIKYYLQEKGEYDEEIQRAGIVHRIDKPAGGLLLIAKNSAVQKELFELYKGHDVKKVYFAKVEKIGGGRVNKEIKIGQKLTLDGYIYRDPKNRIRRVIYQEKKGKTGGRYCKSEFLFINENSCYIRIYTGRTHQIRASLKYLGYSIAGDTLYGSGDGIPSSIDLECVYQSFVLLGRLYEFSLCDSCVTDLL